MILRQLDRLRRTNLPIVVATPATVETVTKMHPVLARQGYAVEAPPVAADDVLARYARVAWQRRIDPIIRVTADCPLIDPDVILQVLRLHHDADVDYAALASEWGDGLDVEVVSARTLQRADVEATLASDREHVTPWIWKRVAPEANRHNGEIAGATLPCPFDLSDQKWSVDDEADLAFVRDLYEHFLKRVCRPDFDWRDVAALVWTHPFFRDRHGERAPRNEGYLKSLANEGTVVPEGGWNAIRYRQRE